METSAPRPLREIRRDRAIGVRELARDLEISANTVHRIERGCPMHRVTMRRISQALGVQPRDVAEFRRVLDGEGG